MLKESIVLRDGLNLLRRVLNQIPFLEIQGTAEYGAEQALSDGIVHVHSPQGDSKLIVEAKNSGEPRFAHQAVNALIRFMEDPSVYGLFIAPYISPQSAQICRDAGIGYLDLSGNCFLSFGQVYVLIENRPNKFSKRRDLVALYSPKTERILRALLINPYRPRRTLELSRSAQVSLGMISMVKRRLGDREWVEDTPEGFVLTKPEKLLEEWAGNYSFQRNETKEYYTMKPLVVFERQLAELCQGKDIKYAFTGFSASKRFAPAVRHQRAMAYIYGEPEDFTVDLGLKPVTSGANVSLLHPYDEGVFYGAEDVDGVKLVNPIQTYLDLKQSRGRGEEAAEILYNEVIQKQWSTLRITMPNL